MRLLCPPPPPAALRTSKPPPALSFGNFSSRNLWSSSWEAFLFGKTTRNLPNPALNKVSLLALSGVVDSSFLPRMHISWVQVSAGWKCSALYPVTFFFFGFPTGAVQDLCLEVFGRVTFREQSPGKAFLYMQNHNYYLSRFTEWQELP